METTPTLHHHVQGVYHSQTSGDPLMFKGCNVYGSDNRNKEFDVNSENVQSQLKFLSLNYSRADTIPSSSPI